MTSKLPFEAQRNDEFHRLLDKLENQNIIQLRSVGSKKIADITDKDTLLEILAGVFISYAMPSNDNPVGFCQVSNRLVANGKFLNLALSNTISKKASGIITYLIESANDTECEAGFNALISIYLGSMAEMIFIYPNTSIKELGGSDTHELDIFLCLNSTKCVLIETTRGFDKEIDKIEVNYAQHLKKAIFHKWAIEHVFKMEVCLCYITLADHTVYHPEISPSPMLPELQKEIVEAKQKQTGDGLFNRIVDCEKGGVEIISLASSFKNAVSLNEIKGILENDLLRRLKTIITGFVA